MYLMHYVMPREPQFTFLMLFVAQNNLFPPHSFKHNLLGYESSQTNAVFICLLLWVAIATHALGRSALCMADIMSAMW